MSVEFLNEILGVELSAEEYEMANILFAACPQNWTYDDMAAAWWAGEKSRTKREKGESRETRRIERESARESRNAKIVAKFAEKARKAEEKEAARLQKEADKQAAKIQKLAVRLEARLEKDDLFAWNADGEAVEISAYTHPELVSMALTIRGAGFAVCFPVGNTTYNIKWLHKVRAQAGVTVPEYAGFEIGDL